MCNDPIDNTEENKGGFSLGTEEVTKSLQKPADNINIPSPKWLQSQMLV